MQLHVSNNKILIKNQFLKLSWIEYSVDKVDMNIRRQKNNQPLNKVENERMKKKKKKQ